MRATATNQEEVRSRWTTGEPLTETQKAKLRSAGAMLLRQKDFLHNHDVTELTCCGETLHWLVAESKRGVEVARRVEQNRGITFRVWRCASCERVTTEGWIPPTWISAVARASEQIRSELEADLARAYGS
jgi:hypothetical protein